MYVGVKRCNIDKYSRHTINIGNIEEAVFLIAIINEFLINYISIALGAHGIIIYRKRKGYLTEISKRDGDSGNAGSGGRLRLDNR